MIDKAHVGPIWRLSWAHPEFGQVLASCSEDRNVVIWGEKSLGERQPAAVAETSRRWPRRAVLNESKGAAADVRFAPRQFGLKLAVASAEGVARAYEWSDPLRLQAYQVEDLQCFPQATCVALDWNMNATSSETIAIVGGEGKLAIWGKSSRGRWTVSCSIDAHPAEPYGGVKDVAWAPNLCRPYELIATVGIGVVLWRLDGLPREPTSGMSGASLSQLRQLVPADPHVGMHWRCSWNLTGTSLALCPENGEVSIWRTDSELEWRAVCKLENAS
eukprot:gnl/MRDRNA2_/MRDRNA2_84565_c0_seq2.p1 gnl/MRDRNA2_/MRDRNA2_84565_c0~~gnl/MRDRNA2_/MRDRNA2_84565_c0_seq2.p1  ORF type:complete len:274 (+),score=35.41 gnl/MRDRNA2_/MRDRNA2_84565_c0_seq2:95-916(+)